MFKKILLTGALLITSASAVALPLMDGKFSMNDVNPSSITVDTSANTVKFTPKSDNFTVTNTDGTFNAINGVKGTINDFKYQETAGDYSIANLFSVGTFTFSLDNIKYDVYESPNGENIDLWGYGTIVDSSGTYDNTVFEWNFNNSKNTWSAYVVPAPAALALLGLGLVGITLIRRNKTEA